MTLYIFYDGGHGIAILLPISVFVTSRFGKIEIYQHKNFRRDNSMHDWDITTSGFWKQMFALLKLYIRFRLSRLRHHRPVILHLPTKFRPNRTIRDIVLTSYTFLKTAATASHFNFRFLVKSLIWKSRNLAADEIFRRDILIHGRDITTSGF